MAEKCSQYVCTYAFKLSRMKKCYYKTKKELRRKFKTVLIRQLATIKFVLFCD